MGARRPVLADRGESGQTEWLFVQRHIRQHMPTRPGIIIPAVLFASWADKGLALVVMGGLCPKKSGRVKTTVGVRAGRNVAEVTTSTLAAGFILTDEKDSSRYTLTRDGQLVSVLDYRDDGHTIALTRAFTIPTFAATATLRSSSRAQWPRSRRAAIARSMRCAGTSPTGSRRTPSTPPCCVRDDPSACDAVLRGGALTG